MSVNRGAGSSATRRGRSCGRGVHAPQELGGAGGVEVEDVDGGLGGKVVLEEGVAFHEKLGLDRVGGLGADGVVEGVAQGADGVGILE